MNRLRKEKTRKVTDPVTKIEKTEKYIVKICPVCGTEHNEHTQYCDAKKCQQIWLKTKVTETNRRRKVAKPSQIHHPNESKMRYGGKYGHGVNVPLPYHEQEKNKNKNKTSQ